MNAARMKKAIAYARGFRLFEGFVLAPLMGLTGQLLAGRTVLDSTAIVSFLLSPKGFGALLLISVGLVLIRMMEQAGLSILTAEKFGATPLSPVAVLHFVVKRMATLVRAAFRGVGLVLAMLAPFLILSGFVARHLLSRHDINFYLAERPSNFLFWGVLLILLAAVTAAVILWNVVRWRWVVQTILFEDQTGRSAFRRSAELVKGIALKVALQWSAIGLLYGVLGLFAAWIGRLILPFGVTLFGKSMTSLGVLLGCLLVLQAILGALILVAAPIVEADVFTRLYFKRSGQSVAGWPSVSSTPAGPGSLLPAWLKLVLFVVLISLGAVAGGLWGTQALSLERPVKIIAHRAAVKDVPENSLPSIEQAIRDGADVAEIDVQLSRDGVVVVSHDRDFSRVAGVAKNVSDLSWNEIQNIDIGAGVGPVFSGARVPRLEQVLQSARGRIPLLIELKHYGGVDGKLEAKVVDLIHRYSSTGQIELQSLEYEALQAARRLEPALPIGYLMSVNARKPARLEVDFLSVEAARADARFLRQARRARQKVYVWTVDKVGDMEQMMDLGVDGLITNQSQAASALVRERRALSPDEKALRRIRAWLAR